MSETRDKESYLFFLEILCVELQRVELNGERAGVFHGDLSFNISADWQARPQLQHRRAELESWLFTLPLGCNEHLLGALSHTDH